MSMYEMNAKELIQLKEKRLEEIRKLTSQIGMKKIDIDNIKNQLYLNTDFKELKLTNDKMRNAYVDKHISEQKLDLELLKQKLDLHQDNLDIINDLLYLSTHPL